MDTISAGEWSGFFQRNLTLEPDFIVSQSLQIWRYCKSLAPRKYIGHREWFKFESAFEITLSSISISRFLNLKQIIMCKIYFKDFRLGHSGSHHAASPTHYTEITLKYACPPRRKSHLDAVSPPEPRLPPHFPIL